MREPPAPLKPGLALRIYEFFWDNPTEELTCADICVKFSANVRTMESALRRLARHGSIESVHVVRAKGKGRAE